MDITLPQAILLLSLNDQTGKTEEGYYQPALAGAALADLFLQGAIELQSADEVVIPLRHMLSLGPFLSMCDREIGAATKPRDLPHWIAALASQKDFIASIADELCHLGALTKAQTKIFGLFTRTVWPEASPVLEGQLKAEMATAMFQEIGAVDERLCLTIALAHAADLLTHNFEASDLEQHADRIAAIAAGQCLTREATEAVVKAVETAIRAAHAVADSVIAGIID
ncbi:MAG: GPP34 family phosphoprotein [Hyphomonadaceae bacterium]|nr:GPP34 family phosphoprotein [Hyphomonadaceae bacterium]